MSHETQNQDLATRRTPAPRPRRPWFGPKRIGWGVRPQTWQGWLIVAIVIAAIILVRFVLL